MRNAWNDFFAKHYAVLLSVCVGLIGFLAAVWAFFLVY